MGHKCKACQCGWNYEDSERCCFCGKGIKENRVYFDDGTPLISSPSAVGPIAVEWQNLYREFNLDVDFSNVKISPHQECFDRIIIVAQGFTLNQVFAACSRYFSCWSYTDDLDGNVTKNDRDSGISYAVRFRNRVEADEELKNLSANELARRNVKGITLLERLLYEFKYFRETGEHLDIQNWTLCVGSRSAGGGVPGVNWRDDRLRVLWCPPDNSLDSLRARSAV